MKNECSHVDEFPAYCYHYEKDSTYFIDFNNGFIVIAGGENNRLCAKAKEKIKKLIFDMEKKTISVTVANAIFPPSVPRIVNLCDEPRFFEDIHDNIEEILNTAGFKSVTPNEDRTVFEFADD